MIETLAILIGLTVLTVEYYVSRNKKTESVCKVWVQENPTTEWICVEKID